MNLSYAEVAAFLYREARLLDDKEWDAWVEMYDPQVEFWMPAWDDDGTLVIDPRRDVSLIYYSSRSGLEDRVFRIKTDRSSATSLPEPRTSHNLSNLELIEESATHCELRFNWFTLSFRYKTTDMYFGTSFYRLELRDGKPLIMRKKVILKNDYIHHVVDVYHI